MHQLQSTYLLLTFAFLQQFADFLLFSLQVVSEVVVLLLRLIDQLVEVRRLLLDLTGFILKTQRLVSYPGSENVHYKKQQNFDRNVF